MISREHRALLERFLTTIRSKCARAVLQHILEHGQFTTEEIGKRYGYDHPPRAARDLREAGIPIVTYRVRGSRGRWIAAYRLGNLANLEAQSIQGRKALPKALRDRLYSASNGRCHICNGSFEERYLQIDHRVPYLVSGEQEAHDAADFMLLCSSCNRAKSWSCEHCVNGQQTKLAEVCRQCYWGSPENYIHIALRQVRRLDILWDEHEVQTFEKIKALAQQVQVPLPEYVKRVIQRHLQSIGEQEQ